MKNWIPERIFSQDQEVRDREEIVWHCVDLSQNDPNAAGMLDSFADTVIGAGLIPHLALNWCLLSIEKKAVQNIQRAQGAVCEQWSPSADAGERMNFGQVQ